MVTVFLSFVAMLQLMKKETSFFVFFMENTYFYVAFSCLAYCARVFFGMRSPNYWALGTKPIEKQTFFVFFIENEIFLRRFLWLICLLIPGPCVWTHENLYFPKETLYALFGKYSP